MTRYLRPALAGLFLVARFAIAAPGADAQGFNHDEALAFSQGVIGSEVTEVELLNSSGEKVSLQSYRGKPLVISLIYSSCHHICPSTTAHLHKVVKKARAALGTDSFNVVSVGFDVANDTPQRMAQFQSTTGVSVIGWEFLAGDQANIDSLVEQLGFIYRPSPKGFDHLLQASILDANGAVYRQIYGITFPTPQLVEPMKELVYGQPRKQSALAYLENRIRLFCTVYDPATDAYRIDVSVFIGTFVGLIVSILFGRVLYKEWRKSLASGR